MGKLPELKIQLSTKKKKPKNARNNSLIRNTKEQLSKQKELLCKEYRNRQMEKQKDEVNFKLSLWKKKKDRYTKIREAKQKERILIEKKKVDKIQQKKKAK